MTCRCFRCLRTFRPLWKWFINQDLVTKQPVVKFLSSRAAAAHRVVVPLQAFLRSLMALSELGLMYPIMVHRRQAKVIKLFILMDVDTQTHTTTRTWAPSYLSYHTPLLTPKHTNTPPDQAGREEGSQYLRSCSYLVPRSRSASHCRQTIEFSTMQLSACSVWAVLEVSHVITCAGLFLLADGRALFLKDKSDLTVTLHTDMRTADLLSCNSFKLRQPLTLVWVLEHFQPSCLQDVELKLVSVGFFGSASTRSDRSCSYTLASLTFSQLLQLFPLLWARYVFRLFPSLFVKLTIQPSNHLFEPITTLSAGLACFSCFLMTASSFFLWILLANHFNHEVCSLFKPQPCQLLILNHLTM